jgi:ATP-dependent RNA helicase RhlE
VNFAQFKLDPRLLAAVERAGYSAPTPIQEAGLPPAMAGHDMIGTAQTGTGKTAVFVLPILQKLLTGPRNRTRALIVAPTRELAEQIHETFRDFAAGTKIRSATVYGGVGAAPQIKALQNGTEVIVACPGRLLDLIGQGYAQLSGIEVLVLDEADRMFDMGFLPDIRRITSYVPKQRQTMLFSATFPAEVEHLAACILNRPQRVAAGIICPARTVSHALYPVTNNLKTKLLLAILKQTDTESVLIFTRTKQRARRLAEQIERAGYKVTSLHGNRTQGQRQSALSGFKDGRYQIMVATDIAARGLDVESISHVINYDMPDTADAYIHRIGRTGRAERSGDAFTLVTPEDNAMVIELEKIMNQELRQQLIPGFNYDAPAPAKPSFTNVRARRGVPSNNRRFSPSQGTAAAKTKTAEIYTASGWRSLSHAI